eukprot:m.6760 g.6760  ORF g.6760 m.6760 type:complete len:188 (+) comp3579_c0_seq1:289-852(+)
MPELDVDVRWLPFFLNASMPETPVNKRDWYNQKFGADRVRLMEPRMTEVGKKVGINFTYDGETANTLDSHRLITWAATKGKQNEVVEECFKGYFEKGIAPNNRKMLVESAEKAGLDKSAAEELLASDELKLDVMREAEDIRSSYGVTGVPFFVVKAGEGRPISFSGAQDTETIIDVFKEATGTRSST